MTRGMSRHHQQKTSCTHGHLWSVENTSINKLGHRVCKPCLRAAVARWKINHPDRYKEQQRRYDAKRKQRI